MPAPARIRIPLPAATTMVGRYAWSKVGTQVRSVAFILIYLVGFKVLILRAPPAQAARLALGIAMVVIGLAFFLEGLLIGLMPLGKRVGVQLPGRGGLGLITGFGLLLGFGTTLAEPAMAALRATGRNVSAWETPLLFMLLDRYPQALVVAIGLGVGVAVALGMIRFARGLSLKPFIYVTIPLLLAVSAWCARDPNLAAVLGLAWDAGAVTTGAVTVPLVLALGIGVSRASGSREEAGGGFGIIMLASAYPVLGVLVLALLRAPTAPPPTDPATFFSPTHRETALRVLGSEARLVQHAFRQGGPDARRAVFADEATYRNAVTSLTTPSERLRLLGDVSLSEWLTQSASPQERAWLALPENPATSAPRDPGAPVLRILSEEAGLAVRAVIPLTLLLLAVLLGLLRSRPRHTDEVVLGVGMAVLGMALLTSGIRMGLAPLGDEVGRPLPRVFRSTPREEGRVVLQPFGPDQILTSFGPGGERQDFFYLHDRRGRPTPVPFRPERYDAEAGRYEHIIERPPMFGPDMSLLGIGLVLLFAFGLGYGSTLAEPALSALGLTVEEITVGTVRKTAVVRAVSVGVGIGLVLGVLRILYDLPMIWMLMPPYLLLLPLTHWSEEDFAGIAWDSGGVTTGSITVPLVLSMGLGIRSEVAVADGFGLLAMASVYPILTVLLFGLFIRGRQRRAMRLLREGDDDE